MKEQTFEIYDDGAEFLDDLYDDDLKVGLTFEQFDDFTYHKMTQAGKSNFKTGKKFNIWIVGSEDYYLINNDKSLYEWYQE